MATTLPTDWPETRSAIYVRAGGRCEWCGAADEHWVERDPRGRWYPARAFDEGACRITCTIAHLNHCTSDTHPGNLAYLCQHCRALQEGSPPRRPAAPRRSPGQMSLFDQTRARPTPQPPPANAHTHTLAGG